MNLDIMVTTTHSHLKSIILGTRQDNLTIYTSNCVTKPLCKFSKKCTIFSFGIRNIKTSLF